MLKFVVKYNEVIVTDNGIVNKTRKRTFKFYKEAKSFAKRIAKQIQYTDIQNPKEIEL